MDVIDEASTSIRSQPGRSGLTALGVLAGSAALVAALGLAESAGGRILSRIDSLTETSVSVEVAEETLQDLAAIDVSPIPWDAEIRLTALNGVAAAGTITAVDTGSSPVRAGSFADPLRSGDQHIPVIAASPGAFAAVGAELGSGRWFDAGHDARGNNVAVVGAAAAARLDIHRTSLVPAVFIGDEAMTVVGILSDVDRRSDLLAAVIVPNGYARSAFGLRHPTHVVVQTAPGATELVATQTALALNPTHPDRLVVLTAGSPTQTRDSVQSDVNTLILSIGGLMLLVGALGIGAVTLSSVLERVGEIGLRRALGAKRRHIFGQFLLESTIIGFLGGALGASVGTLIVVAIATHRGWVPVFDPVVPFTTPLLGAGIGMLAGSYPAWRASALEPADALRFGGT